VNIKITGAAGAVNCNAGMYQREGLLLARRMSTQFSSLEDRLMTLAVEEAKKAMDANEVPVGCVIADETGEIWGTGYNLTNATRNGTVHAEFVAIELALKKKKEKETEEGSNEKRTLTSVSAAEPLAISRDDLSPCNLTLYVTCEPCIMCAAALVEVGIRHVVFGCSNTRFGGCGSITNIHQGVLEVKCGWNSEECADLFRVFYDHENERAPKRVCSENSHAAAAL
jgi:tRNA-specific adenosine deaminase 2